MSCETRLIKKVKQWFKREYVKSQYQPAQDSDSPFFDLIVQDKPLIRLAALNDVSVMILCGKLVKLTSISGERIATLGGVVKVSWDSSTWTLYCLTVGHIFENLESIHGNSAEVDSTEGSTGDSESEIPERDNEDEELEEETFEIWMPTEPQNSVQWGQPPLKHSSGLPGSEHLMGFMSKTDVLLENCNTGNLDWALFSLTDKSRYKFNWLAAATPDVALILPFYHQGNPTVLTWFGTGGQGGRRSQ